MAYGIVFVLTDVRVEILYGHVLDHGTVCRLITEREKSYNDLRTVHHVDSVQRTASNWPRGPLPQRLIPLAFPHDEYI